eukprot:12547531-Prorocentrum_lima.AAC.1
MQRGIIGMAKMNASTEALVLNHDVKHMFGGLPVDSFIVPVGFTYLRCVNIGAMRKRSANV